MIVGGLIYWINFLDASRRLELSKHFSRINRVELSVSINECKVQFLRRQRNWIKIKLKLNTKCLRLGLAWLGLALSWARLAFETFRNPISLI